MPFASLLDHTCDIYHIHRADIPPGYGLPASPTFSYKSEPDILGVPCHFGLTGGNLTVVQATPQANLEAKIKLALPIGTDVRLNDKIVDCETGYDYTAEVPLKVRSHHIVVMLHRSGTQEAL